MLLVLWVSLRAQLLGSRWSRVRKSGFLSTCRELLPGTVPAYPPGLSYPTALTGAPRVSSMRQLWRPLLLRGVAFPCTESLILIPSSWHEGSHYSIPSPSSSLSISSFFPSFPSISRRSFHPLLRKRKSLTSFVFCSSREARPHACHTSLGPQPGELPRSCLVGLR